jgi:sugar-specific transcriptional regulator TrmB
MPDPGLELLETLELTEYEAQALDRLLELGRTTAPNLADATGIPKARIYGVLESLSNQGYVKVIPGRPKEYQPKPPEGILERAAANRRQAYEAYRQDLDGMREAFLEHYESLFETASEAVTPTEELFWVVDVGEPSRRETREIYRAADDQVHILTKSFEYLPEVEDTLAATVERGVDVQVLLLDPRHLTPANREIQAEIRDRLDDTVPGVEYRFSERPLPWRGTIADPSMDYETGTAIFLVEEKDVPLHMRQAAVTENGSLVAGLNRYFALTWEYESVRSPA